MSLPGDKLGCSFSPLLCVYFCHGDTYLHLRGGQRREPEKCWRAWKRGTPSPVLLCLRCREEEGEQDKASHAVLGVRAVPVLEVCRSEPADQRQSIHLPVPKRDAVIFRALNEVRRKVSVTNETSAKFISRKAVKKFRSRYFCRMCSSCNILLQLYIY